MGRLDGKVALVTGGAMGIGKGTCRMFAQEGAQVVVGDIDAAVGEEVARTLAAEGHQAFFTAMDVTSEACWQDAFREILKRCQKVNILVNNAGIAVAHDAEHTSLADWHHVMEVNATGVFFGIKHGIAAMKDNGENCSIINHSSIEGVVAEPGFFAYSASKGAVLQMTKSAALYCGVSKYKIRVNAVLPGYVPSAQTAQSAAANGMEPEEYFAAICAKHPIGYLGRPIDIAYADVYLASDESLFVTGSQMVVDGGYTAQ